MKPPLPTPVLLPPLDGLDPTPAGRSLVLLADSCLEVIWYSDPGPTASDASMRPTDMERGRDGVAVGCLEAAVGDWRVDPAPAVDDDDAPVVAAVVVGRPAMEDDRPRCCSRGLLMLR